MSGGVSRRPTRIAAIAFGVFVFLGISFMLARALTGAGNERALVLDLLRAQARGDAKGVLQLLPQCRELPACASSTSRRVAELHRPGKVEILNFQPSMQLAMSDQIGSARVAWQIERSRKPVVQCVRVHREGPLSGGGTELLSISAPISLEAHCP